VREQKGSLNPDVEEEKTSEHETSEYDNEYDHEEVLSGDTDTSLIKIDGNNI